MSFTPAHLRPDASLSFSLFSSNLKYLRKRRGLNQEDISALFNKKANTVGNWENGKTEPSIPELLVIAGFFGINLEDLLRSELRRRQTDNEQQLSLWPDTTDKGSQPLAMEATRSARPAAGISTPGAGGEPRVETSEPALLSFTEMGEKPESAPKNVPAGDALWFMLRELRTVQEQMDRLQQAFDLSRPLRPADKSDH